MNIAVSHSLIAEVSSLEKGLDEIKPLLPGHYEELSLHKDRGIELDPLYDRYLAAEKLGEVLYVTLRKEGQLVGYFVGLIGPALHYKSCVTLHSDIYYVVPEHRGDGGGMILFDAVRKEAKRRGARYWMSGDKEHAHIHADRLHKMMGFEKIENVFGLWLDD